MDNHEATIIFGGPMSANDDNTLPHIRTELDWIPVALTADKPFLGICLGAQLLARVLGAKVSSHPQNLREIGYFSLQSTIEGKAQFESLKYAYHWHQEGFDLPTGTVKLAQGKTFTNQAFRYGEKVYGLQFHPEITRAMIKLWMTKAADQLSLPGAQSPTQQLQHQKLYGKQGEEWLRNFLPIWLSS